MQDVGGKEDTELSKENLTLCWREYSVESLGHCQSIGNRMFFPREGSRLTASKRAIPFYYSLCGFLLRAGEPRRATEAAWFRASEIFL